MRNAIRRLQQFGIYWLPTSLLILCGALLTALLYPPAPVIRPASSAATRNFPGEAACAEALFLALLADALQQSQRARETQARTLRYAEPLPARRSDRPALIRL